MSKNYIPSDQNGLTIVNGTLGILITAVIFAFLPIINMLDSYEFGGPKVLTDSAAIEPPPPPPEDTPPPPEEQDDTEDLEMEEPPPPMTLAQLEMALNPGSGGAMGDFGFNDFNADINAADSMMVFDLKDLTKKPQATFQVAPIIPYAMQKARIKGWVDLYWQITPDGKVIKARVDKSSHREFEQPCIDAIMKSKWKPGEKDGKAVTCQVTQRIEIK